LPPSATVAEGNALLAPQPALQPSDIIVGQRAPGRAQAPVTVEVAAGAQLVEIQSAWRDLTARADIANVFMHPMLVALSASYPDVRCRALVAWKESDGVRRLVGFWAFAVGRAPRSILPLSVLAAPFFTHAYLAAPAIDRDLLEETLQAMLDHIAAHPALPKLIALDAMREDGATMQALKRVLAARGTASGTLRRFVRPMLLSGLDAKQYMEKALSSSSRKKLRQHRRRLAEKGTLESKTITEPEALRAAMDDFLRLEASGWKGEKGTALLCKAEDAVFARAMIAALAPQGDAWMHALYLNGAPVSMQVVLRAGPTAFTWKTAYDEALSDYSPGMLLLEDYTAAFLADRSITSVDSCAYDEASFMSAWSERQAMADVWIDARRGGSLEFSILIRLQKTYLSLRAQAKAAYLASMRRRVPKQIPKVAVS
jgi:CelD/BcsL family acetyltransferase involved in cellulose biosynthesis